VEVGGSGKGRRVRGLRVVEVEEEKLRKRGGGDSSARPSRCKGREGGSAPPLRTVASLLLLVAACRGRRRFQVEEKGARATQAQAPIPSAKGNLG
jgi:hypothetical protein